MRPSGAIDSRAVLRRHRPDMLMLLFLAILVLLGLIIIYAISPPLIARANMAGQQLDPNYYMYRQLVYLLIGAGGFIAAFMIPADFWRKHASRLVIGGLIVGMLPFVLQATPLGLCANDACRWLNFGIVSFQPAEAMKFVLVLFLATFLAVRIQQGRLNDINHTLIPVGLLLLLVAVIVIGFQRDLGTGVTIFAIVMTMLFMAGLNRRLLTLALAGSLAVGVLFTVVAPHRIERVMTFFNHSASTPDEMGWHINQALIAVGSGGLTGKGLGQSIQAFGYLPEAANDSIFAILAEIFGFLGTLAILAIFAALFLRLLRIMDHSFNPYYKLIVAGVFGWIFSHAIVNIAAMLGVFPLTGITLPFVSFGGSSLLFILTALGLVLQISRFTCHQLPVDRKGDSNEDRRRRGRIGRSRDALPGSFS
jgi:cell division protein FtsW